jgi:hypothetical protein
MNHIIDFVVMPTLRPGGLDSNFLPADVTSVRPIDVYKWTDGYTSNIAQRVVTTIHPLHGSTTIFLRVAVKNVHLDFCPVPCSARYTKNIQFPQNK